MAEPPLSTAATDPPLQKDAVSSPQRWLLFGSLRGWRGQWLVGDLAAGVTLAAIAIPEQMATARLAGLPLAAGFYAFLAGSLTFAVLGESRWMSVGADSTIAPILGAGIAGVMTGGSLGAAASEAAPGTAQALGLACAVAVMVGVLLVLAAVARLGWLADLLSVPVTTGFLAGIAVRIVIAQLPDLLGVPKSSGGPWAQLLGTLGQVGQANLYTLSLGSLVFAAVIVAARVSPRVPGALLAVVAATLSVPLLGLGARGVSTVGYVAAALPRVAVPHVEESQWAELARLAALIAIVCIIQISAVTRSFPPDDGREPAIGREIGAVGVGSIVAGFWGGFVVNASPPRTAIVRSAGGRSQVASLIASLVIVALLAFGSGAVGRVPHAALAGVLVYAATHVFRVAEMRRVLGRARVEFALLVVTTAAIVALPIADGVTFGVVLSLVHGLYLVSRPAAGLLYRVPGTTVWWAPEGGQVSSPSRVRCCSQAPITFADASRARSSGVLRLGCSCWRRAA